MGKRAATLGGTGLAVAIAAALWLRAPAPPESPPPPAAPERLPAFEPVSVEAGRGEGLTLTGVVYDPANRPVPHAEVFLASSAQASLSTVRCSECGEPLLSCPARESGLVLAELLRASRGVLAP